MTSPLLKAVKKGDLAAVRALIDAGGDPNESTGDLLWVAAGRGNVPMLRLLVERGATINRVHPRGWSALSTAAFANHAHAVQFLLRAGASPHIRPEGYPLLNWLDWSGPHDGQRPEVIRLLKDAGAKKHPQWWLNFRWEIEYRWSSVLRWFGIRKPVRHPPGPPPIPVPMPAGAPEDRDSTPADPS